MNGERIYHWPGIAVILLLATALVLGGCTGASHGGSVTTVTTTMAPPSPAATSTPVPSNPGEPFPDALAPGTPVPFTGGTGEGNATVYRYLVRGNYTWTSPSWNSPREQATGNPLEVRYGYNTEMPHDGDVFLFVYLRVVSTGSGAVYAPSPRQFTVSYNGTTYPYSSVHGADVAIDTISGTQYDYLLGSGGTGGYVQPGASNQADGFLIFELPAGFVPQETYVIGNLDYDTRAVWRLA